MRDDPSRTIIELLINSGAILQAYDPEAMEEAARIYKSETGLKLVENANSTLGGADALCVVTQ